MPLRGLSGFLFALAPLLAIGLVAVVLALRVPVGENLGRLAGSAGSRMRAYAAASSRGVRGVPHSP